MIREDALMILHLPKDATREQIEQSYTQLRQLYHPNCYGTPHEFSQLQLEEVLCRELSSPYYKEPEGVQYQNFPQVGYEYAFARYALDARSQQIQAGESRLHTASQILGDLLRRANASAEDYITQ